MRYDEVRAQILSAVAVGKRRNGSRGKIIAVILASGICGVTWAFAVQGAAKDDLAELAALDTQYQLAVEKGDVATMEKLLADDFVVVDGFGKRYSKSDLLNEIKGGSTRYAHQVDRDRTILVFGDTAIITARLWAQGIEDGKPVNYDEWFSDTYVRSAKGWRYVFGQCSIDVPRKAGH